MSRPIAALALAVVLTASVLLGVGFATAGPASASAAHGSSALATSASPAPAASDIAITTYNLYYETTDFCTGSCYTFDGGAEPGLAQLYFTIADTAADHSVNVTINDPNATRDGLVNPVFSATVGINQTTHVNTTDQNRLTFAFPGSVVYGGGWYINASAPLGGFTAVNLTVQTFSLYVSTSPGDGSNVVPGETITVNWVATASSNGAPYTHLTNLTAWGDYTNATTQNLFAPAFLTLPTVGAGTFSFQIPGNATNIGAIDLELWAVVYVGGATLENETGYSVFHLGALYLDYIEASPYPGCDSGNYYTFASGSPVFVCIWIDAHDPGYGYTEYVPGLTVSVHFWDGSANVTPGGNPPTELITNASGPVQFSFIPTAPPFQSAFRDTFPDGINVTISDSLASNPTYLPLFYNYSFQVIPAASTTGLVSVALNSYNYVDGETVFANWTLASTDSTATGPLTASQWAIFTQSEGFIATGPIESTATSGMLELTLPSSGLTGLFAVYVLANNATQEFYGLAEATVSNPTLLLTSSSGGYYAPGQSLSFGVSLTPSALPGTTVYYNVTAYWYSYLMDETTAVTVVAVGDVANGGSFSYAVPNANPATYYVVYAWAQSATAGVYSSAELVDYLETGFQVNVGVNTPSSYSDGSYQPGQTIQIGWSLQSLDGQTLPSHSTIYFYFGYTVGESEFTANGTSGTITVTIPSSTPSGTIILWLYVESPGVYGPNCYAGDECYGQSGLTVNAHPSALDYELGAGSGLTVGWLILLLVILVVAVLLVLLIRRNRAPPMSSPPYNPTTGTMPAPAPAPSSPPPAEWQGGSPPAASNAPPPAAGDSPPPLPTPPGGQ